MTTKDTGPATEPAPENPALAEMVAQLGALNNQSVFWQQQADLAQAQADRAALELAKVAGQAEGVNQCIKILQAAGHGDK